MGCDYLVVLPEYDRWPFSMTAYYGDDVRRPRRPGGLAIRTRHSSESSLIAEVQAARRRRDIGRVDWGGPVTAHGQGLLAEH